METITHEVINYAIKFRFYIRYLGVTIDSRLTCRNHNTNKASATATALARPLPSIGRRLLVYRLLANVQI